MKIKKGFLFLALAMLVMPFCSTAGVIVLEGNYQGKNLYVQNPFASSGVGFCVTEVTVNDQVTTDEIASSAFEIDFANLQLKIGDKVVVKIKHKDDCMPKVLNEEVLKPKSTFNVVSMSVDKSGLLKWSTTGETGKLTYTVEQFRWNKWVPVGEVDGIGTSGTNQYSFKITPHSGKNKFRIKQVDYTGQPRVSQPVEYQSNIPVVTFTPEKVSKMIEFSDATMYEIYDQYGNIVKKGFGKEIDATNMPKGVYYLNYDDKMGNFIKK
ncbi:MAG TPA: hypothetical protein VNG53_08165 [Bacteroidia bacterium]|nr:hypothetical protein [Bacteroidia bacterium]